MKPTLKAPETKHLRLEHKQLLLQLAFSFNLCRYTEPSFEPSPGVTALSEAAAAGDVQSVGVLLHNGRAVQVDPRLTPG
jgi:hypothetical protein